MEELFDSVIELTGKLLTEADERLLKVLCSENSKDIYLTVPNVILTVLERAFIAREALNFSKEKIERLSWLDRINIFPSTDWAITLYHKDYPLNKDGWMILKISITNPLKITSSTGSRNIIYLNELISFSRERIELN